jgi:hypothetical protein
MNCDNCNYKKSNFINAVREIRPGATLLIFFDDEEYGWDTVEIYNKILSEAAPENTFVFVPARMVKGIKEDVYVL